MSEGLTGVVICHGNLAEALVGAVEQISGERDALVAISNADCDLGTLEQRIADAIGDRPAVMFIDIPSGSCMFAAAHRAHAALAGTVALVSGVNLAMLLEFVFHRQLPVVEVAERVARAGGTAIQVR